MKDVAVSDDEVARARQEADGAPRKQAQVAAADGVAPGHPGLTVAGRHGAATGGALAFEVPDDVRYLTAEQLERLTSSFRAWYGAASNATQRRARGRLWLAFLLFRFGALRLGEVLGIDDEADVDRGHALLHVRGVQPRDVPLPEPVMAEVLRVLDDPMMFSLRGQVLRLDPGYLRRRFYERSGGCGIPRDHLSPRVLRHSRAIELLRGGVPLKVVQQVLGHQSVSLAGNLLRFSEDDARRILRNYLRKESRVRTSARNAFTGRVVSVRRSGFLVEVETLTPSGLRVVSIITEESRHSLDIAPGALVTATVKAPWVMLAPAGTGATGPGQPFMGQIGIGQAVTDAWAGQPAVAQPVVAQAATPAACREDESRETPCLAAACQVGADATRAGGDTSVDIAEGTPGGCSLVRNRYAGVVARVHDGGVAAEVVVDLPEGTTLCALVSGACVRELALAEGVPVTVLFKAFSVILNVV